MLDPALHASEPAPGRHCGPCTLCCKVYDVPPLGKAAGKWCSHALPGRGCGIHETRPQHCRSFHCLWMTQSWLGPEWKPNQAKMVLSVDPASRCLFVQVDPGQPNAWKREPYYRHLKQWAAGAMAERRHVVVFLNKSGTVVLPDRDVPLGVFAPGDRIVARERAAGAVPTLDVEKVATAP